MAKYHINPKTGNPGICRAINSCPFGDSDHHYSSKEEARAAYEQEMAKAATAKVQIDEFLEDLTMRKVAEEDMSIDELQSWVDQSEANFQAADVEIRARAEDTVKRGAQIAALAASGDVDKDTLKSLKLDYFLYRDRTADLVDAYLNSKYYTSDYTDLHEVPTVGRAVITTNYDPNTKEWLEQRYNSVGGSDVGAVAKNDFLAEEKVKFYDKLKLRKVEDSKTKLAAEAEANKKQEILDGRGGAIYRGVVWENRIRDEFAKAHPELTVYNIKDQYCNPDRRWQQVNFDGILVDSETGATGILECKTSEHPEDWNDGIPLDYRAQTLYYMNAADVDYAYVTAMIRDGELRTYRLEKDDAVAPGAYDKSMESYIQERIGPWFSGLQHSREDVAQAA